MNTSHQPTQNCRFSSRYHYLSAILIVEDESLLALEIGQAVLSRGAVTIGPLASVESAIASIDNVQIDGAILDVSLRGDYSFAVADRLRRDFIPFVFYTGFDPRIIPIIHSQAPCLQKPTAPRVVVDELFRLIT